MLAITSSKKQALLLTGPDLVLCRGGIMGKLSCYVRWCITVLYICIATGTLYNARVSKSSCEYRNGTVTFYFAELKRARDQKELPYWEIKDRSDDNNIYIISIVRCRQFAFILFLSIRLDVCNRSKNLGDVLRIFIRGRNPRTSLFVTVVASPGQLKSNLPSNRGTSEGSETSELEYSTRRIQICCVYFCLGIILEVIQYNFQNNA